MTWLTRLFAYLLNGSDEQHLSDEWRHTYLVQHEHYTIRQLDQGQVVSVTIEDQAAQARAAFWQAIEAKKPKARILQLAKRKQAS